MAAVIKVLLGRGIPRTARQTAERGVRRSLQPRVAADRDRTFDTQCPGHPGPEWQLVIWVDVLNIYIFACMLR